MTQTLEKKIGQLEEFRGPNYNDNGYTMALYRRSNDLIDLEGIKIPSRIEILNNDGKWQLHPAVFIHHGTYESLKNNEGSLIMFLAEGYTSRHYAHNEEKLYKKAQALGLTNGASTNAKSMPKSDF